MTASSGNGGSGTYAYDGNDMRVTKAANGTTTVSIFSDSSVLAEYDNGAAPTSPSREYVYAGGKMLAMLSGGSTTYYHSDHLSTRVTTDANGNQLSQEGHFPFGELWYQTSGNNKWFFTTYNRDSEDGLDYALARYYNSRTGTFCSADPLAGSPGDPQSWNRYAYVLNNPMSLIDQLGLECVWDDGSYDAEDDGGTGSPGACQGQGGTWIELGQGGGWSGDPINQLAGYVQQIQNGQLTSITVTGVNGDPYVTVMTALVELTLQLRT